jgi:hypothetical protein
MWHPVTVRSSVQKPWSGFLRTWWGISSRTSLFVCMSIPLYEVYGVLMSNNPTLERSTP